MKGISGRHSDLIFSVQNKIVELRGEKAILDSDVAELYGVETKQINQAVKNNLEKFPDGYLFELTDSECEILRSKILTSKSLSSKSRVLPKAFTEKGLYMLATILKSRAAVEATFAIIETFASVRYLKQELVALHQKPNQPKQQSRIKKFGEVLSEIVMPDLETSEIESSLELNFIIGKIKHTVKKIKKADSKKLSKS